LTSKGEDLKSESKESPIDLLLELAASRTPTILYGPPGTGKTRLIQLLRRRLEETSQLGISESIQFHRKFTYEDFIEGFEPTGNGFAKKSGVFKRFCETIPKNSKLTDLFVIDEINRADVTSTFGEVLFALEDRDSRVVSTAHFGSEFRIPESLFLVGTMNTADKSIAHIDFAVRRRFQFIPVFPDPENLRTWLGSLSFKSSEVLVEDYIAFFSRTNSRIRKNSLLGSHMQLGEAMFVPPGAKSIEPKTLHRNFINVVLPQVESYLGFGNVSELGLIFNPVVAQSFVNSRWVSMEDFVGLILESKNDKSTA
jgi:5-methylcytosine-specific restriction protein B